MSCVCVRRQACGRPVNDLGRESRAGGSHTEAGSGVGVTTVSGSGHSVSSSSSAHKVDRTCDSGDSELSPALQLHPVPGVIRRKVLARRHCCATSLRFAYLSYQLNTYFHNCTLPPALSLYLSLPPSISHSCPPGK